MFTLEELKNILALINAAPIKGIEATTVALLQQKVNNIITATTPPAPVATMPAPEAPAEAPAAPESNG